MLVYEDTLDVWRGWKKVKMKVIQLCPTLCDPMDYTVHGIFQARKDPDVGKDWSLEFQTGMGSLSLLQGIFPTQVSNPGLPYFGWILYHVSHKGSTRILECIAYPFSSWFSQPRNWTAVSSTAGGFFTNWAIREARKGVRWGRNKRWFLNPWNVWLDQ